MRLRARFTVSHHCRGGSGFFGGEQRFRPKVARRIKARVSGLFESDPAAPNCNRIRRLPTAAILPSIRWRWCATTTDSMLSLGMAYDHMKAGPNLLQGSNLGGLDLSGSMWLSKHWGVEGLRARLCRHQRRRAERALQHQRPVCQRVLFHSRPGMAGTAQQARRDAGPRCWWAEWMGSSRRICLGSRPQWWVSTTTRWRLAGIIGGHFDLNRSARWVFRITPDAVMTRYGDQLREQDHPDRCELRHLSRAGIQVQEKAVSAAPDVVRASRKHAG